MVKDFILSGFIQNVINGNQENQALAGIDLKDARLDGVKMLPAGPPF